MQGDETALVVIVPEAESIVAPFRARHDPSAALGVPAHITLLYPFVHPSKLDDALQQRLQILFAAHPSFDFALRELRQFPDVAYLAPDPRFPFDTLTRRIFEAHPETPPYGGHIEDPTPHLSIAFAETPEALAPIVHSISEAVTPVLPIECHAGEATLLVKTGGRWHTHRAFPFDQREEPGRSSRR